MRRHIPHTARMILSSTPSHYLISIRAEKESVTTEKLWEIVQNHDTAPIVNFIDVFEELYPEKTFSFLAFARNGREVVAAGINAQFNMNSFDTLADAEKRLGKTPKILPVNEMVLL